MTTAGNSMAALPIQTGWCERWRAFHFPRPQAHYRTGKRAGELREGVPTWRPVAPDVDKLVRALLDGMAGTVFRNDSQVVELFARKQYGAPCAHVVVYEAS